MSATAHRQIFFDTETTGFEHKNGDRVIEFAGVEVIDGKVTGKSLKMRFNPDREVDPGASAINGLTWDMLKGEPRFRDSMEDLVGFIRGAELLAFNSPFDEGFIQAELAQAKYPQTIREICPKITDVLRLARGVLKNARHPDGKKLTRFKLDDLVKFYGIDNTARAERHDALIDSQLLVQVYERLVENLDMSGPSLEEDVPRSEIIRVQRAGLSLPVVNVSPEAMAAHDSFLADIQAKDKVEPVGLKKPAGPRP